MAIPLTKTKSAVSSSGMADFVYVMNLIGNDDLDTCVLDFLAEGVRKTTYCIYMAEQVQGNLLLWDIST